VSSYYDHENQASNDEGKRTPTGRLGSTIRSLGYFYSVHHNFGTEMANEGIPLPALANLMGHSDVKMTQARLKVRSVSDRKNGPANTT